MTAPVYVRTVGRQSSVQDLEVTLRLPQEMAFVGQRVPVTVAVHQRGALVDRTRLSLLLDETVVEQQDLPLAADATREATFQVMQPARGLYRYEIQAEAHAAEVTDVNNLATLSLRVVDEPVRVLVLEGKPYWDTKFLLRTLASDPSVNVTAIIRMAENRFLEHQISAPPSTDAKVEPSPAEGTAVRAEQWNTHESLDGLFTAGPAAFAGYQVIVLGRDADVYLRDERITQLKKWLVEKSGSLVCFRGAPESRVSQQMAELMPVRWTPTHESRFRMQLTESGRAVQWLPTLDDGQDLLANLPSLATVTQPQQPQPLAVVLATTTGGPSEAAPAITYQPLGTGRVVVVEGAGMWRWAFLSPEHQQFDEAYGTLWRSLMRWLIANSGLLPSQQLALRSDKVTFSTEETATATLLMRESETAVTPPAVELTGPALSAPQSIVPVAAGSWPGQYRVVFGKLPEGRYRAGVAGSTDESSAVAAFDVRGNLTERLDVASRPDLMEVIARDSGGSCVGKLGPGATWCTAARLSGRQPAAAQHTHHGVGSLVGLAVGIWLVGHGLGAATLEWAGVAEHGTMSETRLRTILNRVRRRLFVVGGTASLCWAVLAVIIVCLAGVWLDLLWELSPEWRIAMSSVAGLAGVLFLVLLLIRTTKAAKDMSAARHLDRAAGSGGMIVSGWELASRPLAFTAPASAMLTTGLAAWRSSRPLVLAEQVTASQAVSSRPVRRAAATLGVIAAIVVAAAVCLPTLTNTELRRFLSPFADVPPYSRVRLEVTPGDTEVIYGQGLDVQVTVTEGSVEQVELVLEPGAGEPETLPMFPEPGNRWRTTLSRITVPATYFVRAIAAAVCAIRSASSPCRGLKSVRFRVDSSRRTRMRRRRKGRFPRAAWPAWRERAGGRVAQSNRPLSGGTMELETAGGQRRSPPRANARGQPGSERRIRDQSSGRFQLSVMDVAGQQSQDRFSGSVTLLADQRPMIRLTAPEPVSLATPEAVYRSLWRPKTITVLHACSSSAA